MTRVEWTYTVETSRLLRALALAGAGAIGSIFVLVGVGLVFVVVSSLLAGEFVILGLVLAFSLLFGRRLASQIALFRTDAPTLTDVLPARQLLAASVAWAVLLAALLAADVQSELAFAGLVLVAFVAFPLVALLHTEGYVDTEEGVVVADRGDGSGSEATLAEVDRVRRYDIGRIAVLRVGYHDGTGSSARRLLAVPAEQADAVERALVSSDADPPESDRNPAVARALYAFAVGSLALAAGAGYLAVSEGGDAAVIGWYGAAFAVVLAGLFAWLGAVEG